MSKLSIEGNCEKLRDSCFRKEMQVRGAGKERESLQWSIINFHFTPETVETTKREICHQKQEMCQLYVSYLHWVKPNVSVTLVFQEQNDFTQRQDYWKKTIGLDLLVWILAYKLSWIYNTSVFLEFNRDLLNSLYPMKAEFINCFIIHSK